MKPKKHTVGVQFEERLFRLLSKMTDEDGCESLSTFIRSVIMKEAESRGYSTEGIEQPKWGLRKDLSSGDKIAIDRQRRVALVNLIKAREARNQKSEREETA